MNHKVLHILEYQKILQQMSHYAVTDLGLRRIEELHPSTKEKEVTRWLEETKDAFYVLRIKGGFPLGKLSDIDPHLKRIEISGTLSGIELAQVAKVLRSTEEVSFFLTQLLEEEDNFYSLKNWKEQLLTLPQLTKDLKKALEEDGSIKDEASEELYRIRRQIKRQEQQVKEQLTDYIHGKYAKYLSDTLITMRNERYVIPVKQEYRNVFGGVVHDQSASGQTLFMEPKSVVDLNNRLRQLQVAQREEIIRILNELSQRLSPYTKEIRHNAYVLGQFDLMNAKAKYAREIKATIPILSTQNHVTLKAARHPLLDAKKVVANDIILGKDYQTLVITGPNTGGKTITLKTLGLLQLMAQSGLAIPVKEESTVGIFDAIYADIGDEQSIEQNLSTFSSHMTNIVTILKKVTNKSLVLFDELGAGTDPQEGAALAISILDYLQEKKAYVMATTHYPELKLYGYNRKNTINASMEFNIDTLSPTYRLLIGVPGRSNAFDISKRLGLQSTIIQHAKTIIDGESQNLNEMIADLENQRKMTEMEYHEVRFYTQEAQKTYDELKKAYTLFYEQKEQELEKAKKKANQLVEKAQEKAEKIIADLRNKQLEIGHQNIKEHEFIAAKASLNELKQEEKLKKNKVLKRAKEKKVLKIGDEVFSQTYGQRGVLLKKDKQGNWQVQMGILKMTLPESDLTTIAPLQEPKKMVHMRSSNASHVSPELDLRGTRYEQALHEVDHYLDAAILAGYPQVRIIHGKGTGALRKGITEYLKNHRSVKSFEFAPSNQGGNGATIVHFK